MTRGATVLMAVVLMIGLSSPCAYASDALRKFSRGVTNVVTGWLEIPIQISQTTEQEGSIAGSTVGLVKGIAHGIGRTLVGLVEVVTFPFPNHTGDENVGEDIYGPLIEPEFVLLRRADID